MLKRCSRCGSMIGNINVACINCGRIQNKITPKKPKENNESFFEKNELAENKHDINTPLKDAANLNIFRSPLTTHQGKIEKTELIDTNDLPDVLDLEKIENPK